AQGIRHRRHRPHRGPRVDGRLPRRLPRFATAPRRARHRQDLAPVEGRRTPDPPRLVRPLLPGLRLRVQGRRGPARRPGEAPHLGRRPAAGPRRPGRDAAVPVDGRRDRPADRRPLAEPAAHLDLHQPAHPRAARPADHVPLRRRRLHRREVHRRRLQEDPRMTHDHDEPPTDHQRPDPEAPPFDLAAEQAVLGSMILSSRAGEEVIELVRPEDFYRPAHETIYRALVDMHTGGQAHDPIALGNRLERDGDLVRCGDRPYLFGLVNAVHTVANAEYHALIVREKAALRKVLSAAHGMAQGVRSRERSPEEIVQDAYDTLEGLAGLTDLGADDLTIGVDIMDTVAEVVDIRENGPKEGLLTGFTDFDSLTGGLQPGQFVLIAARPAMGKSVLAGDFARHTAIRNDIPTVFFSLEMGRKELEKRFLSAQARYPLHWMKSKGPVDDAAVMKLIEAGKDMQASPLHIVADTGVTLARIRSHCRRVQRRHGLGLVVIDYL